MRRAEIHRILSRPHSHRAPPMAAAEFEEPARVAAMVPERALLAYARQCNSDYDLNEVTNMLGQINDEEEGDNLKRKAAYRYMATVWRETVRPHTHCRHTVFSCKR